MTRWRRFWWEVEAHRTSRTLQDVIVLLLALLVVVALARAARAFPDSRCVNASGPTPPFATRDAAQCLLVDPGTGAPPVRFDWLADRTSKLVPPSSPKCTTNDCGYIAWRVNADDFAPASTGSSGGDAFHFAGRHYRYMLFKEFGAGNTFKCQGGSWTSPTGGQRCTGNTSSGHVDAIQIRGQPVNDGWAVFQDSTIANANDIHMILEMDNDQEYVGPAPGFVFQNVRVGYFPDWGLANDWTRDCQQMGDDACGIPAAASARWQVGSQSSGSAFKATWLINSFSHVRVEADRTKKLIVVNGGFGGPCSNATGCGAAAIGYENGWPAPLGHATPSRGVGSCPNGQISGDVRTDGSANAVPVYCYTSIERALAAGHERPPFLHLSPSGWENPPGGPPTPAPIDCSGCKPRLSID